MSSRLSAGMFALILYKSIDALLERGKVAGNVPCQFLTIAQELDTGDQFRCRLKVNTNVGRKRFVKRLLNCAALTSWQVKRAANQRRVGCNFERLRQNRLCLSVQITQPVGKDLHHSF